MPDPSQCVCGNCGAETTVIGYEVSEVLDVEPARVLRAGDQAREAGLQDARARRGSGDSSHRIIDKSLVSDRVIIDTVVKICDHCPLIGKVDSVARRGHRYQPGHDVRLGDDHRRDVDAGGRCDAQELLAEVTSRRMKLRSMCRRTTAAAQIIRLICGSMERRGERRCSISV